MNVERFFFSFSKTKTQEIEFTSVCFLFKDSIPVVPQNKQTFFFSWGEKTPFLAGRNFVNLAFTKNVAKNHDHAQVSKWDGLKY